MSDFNWNDHPIVPSSSAGKAPTAAAFNWDDHPIVPPQSNSWLDTQIPGGTPRGYIKGALNTLPTVGMVGGGIVGSAAGPLGAVGGAGVGAAGGEALKNLGEGLLGEDKTRSDIYMGPVKAGLSGAEAEMGGQLLGKGIAAAADTSAGKYILSKAGQGATKLASTFSGVPEKEISTYAKNADEINALSKSADNDSQEMADQLRQKLNQTIQTKRQQLNGQIAQAVASNDAKVDVQPIVDQLEASKARINAKLRPDEISQVDGMIAKTKDLATDGQLSLSDAHDLKEWLRDSAKGTYQNGGQIFQTGDQAAKAAKAGSAVTRSLVNEASPEIAGANSSLARLHDIEDVMNKNMLSEGKTAASLYAAGSGGNPANAKVLKQLGDETGTDMLGDAEKIAAARTFGKPSILPVDATGKSLTRMGAAGAAGYLVGHVPGAVIAEGLASPAALKVAINAGRAAGPIAKGIAQDAPSLIGLPIQKALAPKDSPNVEAPDAPLIIQPAQKSDAPTKGPTKWANDGLQNLIEHDPDAAGDLNQIKDQLMTDPKAKDLLVKASDLKPGTKAMDKVLTQIKSRMDKEKN